MGLSLAAEQRELKESAAAFARAQLIKDLAKREESEEIPLEAWLAGATPLLLETSVLESLSLGGGRE